MKTLLVVALLLLSFIPALTQTTKPTPADSGQPASQANIPKPEPGQFASYDDYIEALVNWKMRQTQPGKTQNNSCATLRACKAVIQQLQSANDSLSSDLTTARAENAKLIGDNRTLMSQNTTLMNQYQQLRDAAMQVYTFTHRLMDEYNKAIASNKDLTDKYNALLNQANTAIAQLNARLARQQRVANALAIYSMMPKYQPIQLPPPPVFTPAPSVSIHCTSTNTGLGITNTDCH